MPMHEFIASHRLELIDRCRGKAALRASVDALPPAFEHGVSTFLEQLIQTLQVAMSAESAMGASAAAHAREVLEQGYTLGELVHDYGDLCQSIMELATELDVPFSVEEFRVFNLCLDNAIADAVTEFAYQRDFQVADQQADSLNVRLGNFAHELRNQLAVATMALAVIRLGNVSLNGATGAVLDRSLVSLRNLIDRSLAEVRVTAGLPAQRTLFPLADFIAEMQLVATLEANVKGCTLNVSHVDHQLAVSADRDLLAAALGNLLQNAFKFTSPSSEIRLKAYSTADRILIDVEDHCGGLPQGDPERLFVPFEQADADKSGLGLGLTIARRSVEANDGRLSVRNVPGIGCVFTIDLPRHVIGDETDGPAV